MRTAATTLPPVVPDALPNGSSARSPYSTKGGSEASVTAAGRGCSRASRPGSARCRVSTQVEADSLSERQIAAPIDRRGLAAHVELPCVRARLAPAAGILLAAEGTADLGTAGADVYVGDAAVAAARRQERLCGPQAAG